MSILAPNEYYALLKQDFVAFIERAFYELNPETPFLLAPHIEVIASTLEAVRRGEERRVIINIPPRSLKSHSATVSFAAWYLGHFPAREVICVSYGQDLTEKFAFDCRQIMMSPWYRSLFGNVLAKSNPAVKDYKTTKSGSRLAVSVGGPITGRGADLILIDDPQKPEETLSESARKAVNTWYDGTLLSRLNQKSKGAIVIIMQRLHQDDLVGHVLEQEGWKILSFPAIAEEEETHVIDSPYGRRLFVRKPGDLLHPARDSKADLDKVLRTSGSYIFSSQYQQNPIPVGGNIIKTEWLQYYDPADIEYGLYSYTQSWDTASKTAEVNDYSVCTTWAVKDSKYYLLDVFRKKLEYPDLLRAVQTQAEKYPNSTIVIEDKSSGTQLIQELQRLGMYYVKEYKPPNGSDKQVRLRLQSARFESGRVLLPRSALWLEAYIKEITGFPGHKHDDQVDSTTQALDYMANFLDMDVWHRLGQSSSKL